MRRQRARGRPVAFDRDLDVEQAVGRDDLLDEFAERGFLERRGSIVAGEESLPKIERQRADLFLDQTQIVRALRGDQRLGRQFMNHQRHGRQRRAQFVRRRGGEAVELGEMLLAGENRVRWRSALWRVGAPARRCGCRKS